MRKYDHIFFDLDHTLWDFETNSRKALELVVEKSGLDKQLPSFVQFLNIYEQVNHRLWDEYRQQKVSKNELTRKRFELSLKPFGIHGVDYLELNDLYLDLMAEQTAVIPGTFELLEQLKIKGFQMHIITNGFYEVQTKKIHTSEIGKYISNIYISEIVQTPKPERAIFEYALKSSNARKARSIMVGDNWEVDILGALRFGIDQVMFLNNNNIHSVPKDIEPQIANLSSFAYIRQKRNQTFFINQLSELLQLVYCC